MLVIAAAEDGFATGRRLGAWSMLFFSASASASPTACVVYENVRHDITGLHRPLLEQATAAEVRAGDLLTVVAKRATPAVDTD